MQVRLPFEAYRLDNGLRLLVHEDDRLPLVCVNIWYRVGSKDERPGRTGFAHLFEHLMFEGSPNVPYGAFDRLLEEVGGTSNGSTTPDRTNYWITVPSTAQELALFLEADRMGGLADVITQAMLDAQRDVVMNERRQSYENRPYGLAHETMLRALYPPEHPYSWPVIGSMADLRAATLEDVLAFFHTFYAPANAVVAVAGDVQAAAVRELVERHFGGLAPRPAPPPAVAARPALDAPLRLMMEDTVTLPRLCLGWHSPALFETGDAELELLAALLAQGRASRLYRTLVHERQIAQDVSAYQNGGVLDGTFHVVVTARPGQPLDDLEAAVATELDVLAREGPAAPELGRARSRIATAFVGSLETVGGFGGRADQLNYYECLAGDAAYLERDMARYEDATAAQVQAAAARCFGAPSVALSIVPPDRPELALRGSTRVEESA
jgi:zinc protease